MFDLNLAISMKKNPCSEKSSGSCGGWPSHWSNAAGKTHFPKSFCWARRCGVDACPLPRSARHHSVCICGALAGGCRGPAASKSPSAPAAQGGCSSGTFWKDVWLLRVSRATGGHPVPAAWQCSQFHFIPLDKLQMLCLQGMCRE